jgi:hypothetical protein
MPKVIVVFFGAEAPAVALAEAAADGAAGVRFTEVEVRAGTGRQAATPKHDKLLISIGEFAEYAGIVFAVPSADDVPADLVGLLDLLARQAPPGAFANSVFAVVGGENTVVLGRVSRLGGLIVSEARGVDDPEDRARATGRRVAKVVEWVRHAMSHEHGDHHHH